MTLVIDASVALKWVLPEAESAPAAALREQELIAPSLWLVEAANGLWRRQRSGELSPEQVAARVDELITAPVTSVQSEVDIAAAAAIAVRLGHPVYDCLYLALATREGVSVVTADRRFHAAANREPEFAGRVRLLG